MNIKKYIIGLLLLVVGICSFLPGVNMAHAQLGTQGLCDDGPLETACSLAGYLWEPDFGGSAYCTCKTGSTRASDQDPAPTDTNNQSLIDMAALLDVVLNFLYIIIRPLLTITGLALDNSLVYGEVFNLTPMLRRFWAVMMNIAFLLLALGIIRDIGNGLREGKLSETLPKKVKNWFLAGLFIPLSRFAVSAMVDLSTILIYQVGGIPLTILGESDSINMRLLNNSSTINLVDRTAQTEQSAGGFRFTNLYSCGGEAYVPCAFVKNKMSATERDNQINAKLKEFEDNPIAIQRINDGKERCAYSPTILMEFKDGLDLSDNEGILASIHAGTGHMADASIDCALISDLTQESKGMVGSLYAIYGALLNFTSINITTSGKSVEAEVILFLIKGIVGLLLVIPLIALAFTALARIGILWVVIAFSPFIALYYFMGKDTKFIKDIGDNMGFKFGKAIDYKPDVTGIISVIFQPVLVVFALGISIIFLSATNQMLGPTGEQYGILDALGIMVDNSDPEYQTYGVQTNGEHTTDIKIKKFAGEYTTSIFFDLFTRIIANILGILIMRKLMFAALGTAGMSKAIVDKVKKVGEDYISTRPIIGGYSWNSVKSVSNDVIDAGINKLKKDTTEDNAKALGDEIKARRFPNSEQYQKNNSKFVLQDPAKATTKEAADQLVSGLTNIAENSMKNDKNYHFANTSDTPAMKILNNKLGISGNNLGAMAQTTNFWKALAEADGGNTFINSYLNKALTDDATARSLAGTSSSAVKGLRAGLLQGGRVLESSPWLTTGTGTTASVPTPDGIKKIVKIDGNNIYMFSTKTDANNNTNVESANMITGITAANVGTINAFTQGVSLLHSAIANKFGISTAGAIPARMAMTTGTIYADDKKFEVGLAPS